MRLEPSQHCQLVTRQHKIKGFDKIKKKKNTIKWSGCTGLEGALNPITGALIKREKFRDTERISRDDGGREQSGMYPSQGTPRMTTSHQKLGEGHGTPVSEHTEETSPADTLISNVWSPVR